MAVEVPSEPCLQYQIRTVVQYYIPGGHSDRRGRGELCTGRGGEGKSKYAFVNIWTWELYELFAKIVELYSARINST